MEKLLNVSKLDINFFDNLIWEWNIYIFNKNINDYRNDEKYYYYKDSDNTLYLYNWKDEKLYRCKFDNNYFTKYNKKVSFIIDKLLIKENND
jgi:hypothetical protein